MIADLTRKLLLASVLLTASASAAEGMAATGQTATSAAATTWLLHEPAGRVDFKGIAEFDSAGLGTGSILYPGSSAAGFFAAVLAHAAVAESAKDSQKAKIQAEANNVLDPYQPVLREFEYRELLDEATGVVSSGMLERVTSLEDGGDDGRLIMTDPVFFMTQDQQAIVLDTTVSIYAPGQREKPAYQNFVRVVSLPENVEEPRPHWLDADGARLKKKSAALFARALDVAIKAANAGYDSAEKKHRTFRYPEGGVEKIERAQLMNADCERMLLKTLRGHLYLVPASGMMGRLPSFASAPCGTQVQDERVAENIST